MAAVLVSLLVGLGGCGLLRDDPPLPEATRLCDLGRDNDQQVAGHDLAASTELSDGRVLIVFGDTFIGDAAGEVRESDLLLSSSGAVLPAGAEPCDESLEYLTDASGDVRPLLPATGRSAVRAWPIDVAALDGRVWMLYREVERVGEGTLEIEVVATGLAVADEDDLVFEVVEDELVDGPRPLPSALAADGDGLVALVCDGAGQRDEDRCELRDMPITGTDGAPPALGARLDVPALDLAAAEMSLGRVEVAGAPTWRVSSMPDLACVLQVAVLGDDGWETEAVLEPDVGDGELCYAGRIQEALSSADELVLTWVDSASPPTDADLYWPHVERVSLG